MQSAICEPSPTTIVHADDEHVTVKGYAYSGGGKGIIRVDVSIDGGKTWFNPELDNQGTTIAYLLCIMACLFTVYSAIAAIEVFKSTLSMFPLVLALPRC